MNHFMLGHLMEWHYAYVAGIRQKAGSVGWANILIAPHPGLLEYASASFSAPTGKIVVNWRQANGKFEMTVTVPRGITAEAMLPDGSRQALKAGKTILHGKSRK